MAQLFETTQEVKEVLSLMNDSGSESNKIVKELSEWDFVLEESRTRLTRLMGALETKTLHPVYVQEKFLKLGEAYMSLLWPERVGEFPAFLLKKHQEYGLEPLMLSRVRGMVDRMLHKLARIKNLQKRETNEDEHIQLEIQDLLGYSILSYLFIEKHRV